MKHFNYAASGKKRKKSHIFEKELIKSVRDKTSGRAISAQHLEPAPFHTAHSINGLPGCSVTRLGLIHKDESGLISLAKSSPPGVLSVVGTRADLFAVPLGVRMRGGTSLEFLPGSGGGWTGLDG